MLVRADGLRLALDLPLVAPGGANCEVKLYHKRSIWGFQFKDKKDVTVIHSGDGPIRSIVWCGALIAWASDNDVKVCGGGGSVVYDWCGFGINSGEWV